MNVLKSTRNWIQQFLKKKRLHEMPWPTAHTLWSNAKSHYHFLFALILGNAAGVLNRNYRPGI